MGQNWAITVGINQYKYLSPLSYAAQDAESVKDFLCQELGVKTVYHFSDHSPPIPQDYGPDLDSRPDFTTLRRFLKSRFEEPFLNPGDNLWFFFAGHGIQDQNRDYLFPIDGNNNDIEYSAIP